MPLVLAPAGRWNELWSTAPGSAGLVREPRVRYTMLMAFGRNPHVAKAQAAEQKARDATDDTARARSLRDAAHQWERAAEREPPGKRRLEYEGSAARARALAEGGASDGAADPIDPKLMN